MTLTGTRITPDDVKLLKRMDAAFMSAYSKEAKGNRERQTEERKLKGVKR